MTAVVLSCAVGTRKVEVMKGLAVPEALKLPSVPSMSDQETRVAMAPAPSAQSRMWPERARSWLTGSAE
jgi:hypothetical protein